MKPIPSMWCTLKRENANFRKFALIQMTKYGRTIVIEEVISRGHSVRVACGVIKPVKRARRIAPLDAIGVNLDMNF